MRKSDPYPLMRQFMAPAWSYSAVWRIVMVFFAFELGFQAMPFVYDALVPSDWPHPDERPIDTIVDFAVFGVPCLATLLAVRLFHRRGLASLLGPRDAFWRDTWRVALAVGTVILVQEVFRVWTEWPFFAEARDTGRWAVMLPLGLAVLFVQVSTEEIYFRGYLQQQLAVISPSRWVWMVLPSVYFGFAHVANGATTVESLAWMIWAGCLGYACADLTARTGNLGAAIGLHLSNNIFAVMVTGTQFAPGSGLALFLYPADDGTLPATSSAVQWLELPVSLFGIGLMWLAARIAIRR